MVFSSVAGGNPARFVSALLPSLLFFPFIFLMQKTQRIFIMKLLLLSMVSLVFFNAYWILPLIIYNTSGAVSHFTPRAKVDLSQLLRTSKNAKISQVFRFLAPWFWYDKAFGTPYVPYSFIYDIPINIVLNFIIPIISFMTFLLKRNRPYTLYFGITSLIGLAFSAGPNAPPPFNTLFIFLYTNFPLSFLFRNPYNKFMILECFSLISLFALALESINYYLSKRYIKIIFYTFVTFVILSSCAPSIIGSHFIQRTGSLPSYNVKIPAYWLDFSNWINSQPNEGAILLLPPNPFYQVHYLWGYHGLDIASPYLLNKPTIVKYVRTGATWISNPFYTSLADDLTNAIKMNLTNINLIMNFIKELKKLAQILKTCLSHCKNQELQLYR